MLVTPQHAGLVRQVISGSAASLGTLASAVVFAWLTPILPALLAPDSHIPMSSEEASWMVSIPEIGNLISPVPASYFADRYGRKIVILSSAPILLSGWLIILYYNTLLALNVARFIQGLAVGIVFTIVPMYLGEIASPKYRGLVTSMFFFFWWFGFLFEYIIGPQFSYLKYTYISASTNIIFFIAFLWQPESPYYYLMKNESHKALKSLTWLLCATEEEASKELESMRKGMEEEVNGKEKMAWSKLVSTAVDRKALMILFLGGFLRQCCGLMSLSTYSTQTLSAAGDYFFISPHNVTILMGIMMMLGCLASSVTLDLFGRRSLLFISSLMSGITMLCAGTFYLLNVHVSVNVTDWSWVPPISLIVFSGVSVAGIFPVSVAYTSELFPTNTRGTASSVFSVYTTILGLLMFKFYLTISNVFGLFVNFYFFAVVCIFGSLLACSVMPETKGKTFEQIRHELNTNKKSVQTHL